jgi:DNA-binding response OmpR family regulator
MRILVAEDDLMIGDALCAALHQWGYAVDWVKSGQAAEAALSTGHVDMLLLDLGLPGKDGMTVLRHLRGRKSNTPVIIITARDAVEDRIKGLDSGADDYVVKPFNLDELAARIRSALRRGAGHAAAEFHAHGVSLNPATKEVAKEGRPVPLSAREYALVEALMIRPGQVLSRAQLEERMYGWNDDVESNTVEVYIHAVRRKLGADFIQNVRGVGYFVPKDGGQE